MKRIDKFEKECYAKEKINEIVQAVNDVMETLGCIPAEKEKK